MEGDVDSTDDPCAPAVDENIDLLWSDADADKAVAGFNKGSFFNNGYLKIDVVLSYVVDDDNKEEKAKWRARYLDSLRNDYHLKLEEAGDEWGYGPSKDDEKGEQEKMSNVNFIKVHAPIDVLYDSAEDLAMKMPTKLNDINIKEWYDGKVWNFLKSCDPFYLKHRETQDAPKYFVATFDKERRAEFVNHDVPEKFFTPAERGRLVHYLLEQAKYGDEPTDIGIGNLIHKGVFLDAYPLHDGSTLHSKHEKTVNERQKLQKDWASFNCIFRYQPINSVREYFGEKVALYFSWLGFYTAFLIPAAIVGSLCFLYGVLTAMYSPAVLESCSDPTGSNGTGHLFYMCPLCDKKCAYFLLSGTCVYAKVSHFFDNEATLFFAVFMSIWATLFLEFWKRRQISLAYEWHSMGFEEAEEQVRPEYVASNITQTRLNPINHKYEPHMPQGMKITRMMGTVSVVAFFILLVLVAVIGVFIFRAALSVSLIASNNAVVQKRSKMIVSASAGILNLVAINILKLFYNRVAVVLTDWENPRTRTDYEDSFTVKMFLFQFFNTYSSIIYVAFLKTETITGTPGNYNRFSKSRFRMDGCSAQGCFLELTIQLIIIMVGQQFISNIVETLLPTVLRWWKDRKGKKNERKEIGGIPVIQPQWVDDYECQMQTKFSLFWEYLELVLQYGFVTMFVAAFPLAPFFALLNNVIEIRVDAYNYIHNCRRPFAHRAEDIGAWYNILATLTSVSVLMNALVLAFTSEIIPRLVYRYTASSDGTTKGYVDWSLSSFNVADFDDESRPLNTTVGGVPMQDRCRYPGYHDEMYPYNRSVTYWMILTTRLAFVLFFVLFVLVVSWAISYVIPDIPKSLKLTIKREKFLASQADKDHKEKVGKRPPRPAHDRSSKKTTKDEEKGQCTSPV